MHEQVPLASTFTKCKGGGATLGLLNSPFTRIAVAGLNLIIIDIQVKKLGLNTVHQLVSAVRVLYDKPLGRRVSIVSRTNFTVFITADTFTVHLV